jgi:hypothetical protein
MEQRGRKGRKAPLAIVVRRPPPPDELNDLERGIWRSVVDVKPSGWFGPDTRELLIAYCRHAVAAREIDTLIAPRLADPAHAGRAELPELLVCRERETRILLALSRAMRLTQQSRYRPDSAPARQSDRKEGKPWERNQE